MLFLLLLLGEGVVVIILFLDGRQFLAGVPLRILGGLDCSFPVTRVKESDQAESQRHNRVAIHKGNDNTLYRKGKAFLFPLFQPVLFLSHLLQIVTKLPTFLVDMGWNRIIGPDPVIKLHHLVCLADRLVQLVPAPDSPLDVAGRQGPVHLGTGQDILRPIHLSGEGDPANLALPVFLENALDSGFPKLGRKSPDVIHVAEGFHGLLRDLVSGPLLFGSDVFRLADRLVDPEGVVPFEGDVLADLQRTIREYMVLVGIACVIGIPIAVYAAQEYLKDFIYRLEGYWWIFVVAVLLTGLIAFVSVIWQVLKAAKTNPAIELKKE